MNKSELHEFITKNQPNICQVAAYRDGKIVYTDEWDGKQIISSSWIEEMTRPRPVDGNMFRGMQYGYMWWIIHPEKKIYAAIGNSGNVIYVNPEKNTVVAVASYFKPTIFDRVDFIEKFIL